MSGEFRQYQTISDLIYLKVLVEMLVEMLVDSSDLQKC